MKEQTVKAIIFDLYGTLLRLPADSKPISTRLARRHPAGGVQNALHAALTTNNVTLQAYAKRIGLPTQKDLQELVSNLQNDINQVMIYPDVMPI